ncbi:HET-domain-containing protein [Curvularia clavata]|uniref:HET-domain-containing protein n=1 Tax=Curvularia clavata TaxID=95742 RepID=A0A9Q8Z7E3_CURCL|nr:HET-domain-containing protein [Curvularia clavata]
MRLIKVDYCKCEGPKLEDFTFRMNDLPRYVIFSHRWLSQNEHGGDVTFKEFNDSEDQIRQAAAIRNPEKRKAEIERLGLRTPAFDKLLRAVEVARGLWASHIWIDSCCINRDNSSELTEALNSMYRYYKEADTCLVYLHDFGGSSEPYEFSNQQWFKRGWTLQELIAPKRVNFYNQNWEFIGTRSETAIAEAISKVTKIPKEALDGRIPPYEYSVAQRMSWAANRDTTRGEDMAYSLFGLFDVNLTPIYGEGAQKAFLRLQEAILSSTNDMSLFAWTSNETNEEYRGILARSPKEFREAGNLVHRKFLGPNPEFSMTNRGLKIMPLLSKRRDDTYFMPLNCAEKRSDSAQSLGIILAKRSPSDERLYRYKPAKLAPFDNTFVNKDYRFWLRQSETPIYIVRNERVVRRERTVSNEKVVPTNERLVPSEKAVRNERIVLKARTTQDERIVQRKRTGRRERTASNEEVAQNEAWESALITEVSSWLEKPLSGDTAMELSKAGPRDPER